MYIIITATQEEAATAYDLAAIEYRGLNAVTNFDLSRYIKWLKPNNNTNNNDQISINLSDMNNNCTSSSLTPNPDQEQEQELSFLHNQDSLNTVVEEATSVTHQPRAAGATSALELLLQSSKFKEMMEMTSVANMSTQMESELPQCAFPDHIQTYFEYEDSNRYEEVDDLMFKFNEFSSIVPFYHCDEFQSWSKVYINACRQQNIICLFICLIGPLYMC